MDEDLIEESQSESGSEFKSYSESESLSDDDRGKQEKKKKANKNRPTKGLSKSLRETVENKSELSVTCGDKEGILYVEKYDKMEKCIFSEGQWFMPNEFERFGGKERNKKWKISIYYNRIPLQKFIEDGCLSSFKKISAKNDQDDSVDSLIIAQRKRKRTSVQHEEDDSPESSPESSPVAGRLRARKYLSQVWRQPSPISLDDADEDDNDEDVVDDDEEEKEEEDGDNVDEDEDDGLDITIFEGPTLPVKCGSDSGVLHKYRFATGHCGKCIRTKEFWLTPESFITLNLPGGVWRRDIVSHGVPLGKLIMKGVLELHMINCDCEICEDLDQYQQNDDVCMVCDSDGDLVCCDECPRAFHLQCHLPTIKEDSSGSKWSCTFCAMKKMNESSEKTQQDVLGSPVSQYTLHCQYLLLHLLCESKTNPRSNVQGCSEIMKLGKVKRSLEKNDYQTVQEFVADIESVFNNCSTSSADNRFSMTSRLKDVLDESKSIFKLQ